MTRLNREFLKHDYSTDVISFPLGGGPGAHGEIYVNLDKARSQAGDYGVSYGDETRRLLIHGLLHLLGYEDATKIQQANMKKIEEHYVARLRR